jgi:hypothetical protein
MIVKKVDIHWNNDLPIFASEKFLRAVGDEYGWLGGFDDSGTMCCVLPYTILKKAMLRMVRFRVETIPFIKDFSIDQEKAFLNGVVNYFKSYKTDMIIPATTNSIFRTFPDGADAAPYGSYVIDLSQSEEVLWRNVSKITRQNINTAKKNGITIKSGMEYLNPTYQLVRETFKRSNLPFMSKNNFERYVHGLGNNGKILVADFQGVIQSYVVFGYSDYCAYAIYAGNVAGQQQGSIKLLLWEAICVFRSQGVKIFDFVGARINPEKGSKQDTINSLKRHFGAELKQGYIWKYGLSYTKYLLFGLASRLRSGGDIVDAERHKLHTFTSVNDDSHSFKI